MICNRNAKSVDPKGLHLLLSASSNPIISQCARGMLLCIACTAQRYKTNKRHPLDTTGDPMLCNKNTIYKLAADENLARFHDLLLFFFFDLSFFSSFFVVLLLVLLFF